MSKAKEYINNFPMPKEIEDAPEMIELYKMFIDSMDIVSNKTLEDVSDVIHNNYTEEWSDEVGLFIDKILEGMQSLKL